MSFCYLVPAYPSKTYDSTVEACEAETSCTKCVGRIKMHFTVDESSKSVTFSATKVDGSPFSEVMGKCCAWYWQLVMPFFLVWLWSQERIVHRRKERSLQRREQVWSMSSEGLRRILSLSTVLKSQVGLILWDRKTEWLIQLDLKKNMLYSDPIHCL